MLEEMLQPQVLLLEVLQTEAQDNQETLHTILHLVGSVEEVQVTVVRVEVEAPPRHQEQEEMVIVAAAVAVAEGSVMDSLLEQAVQVETDMQHFGHGKKEH
jgi:hypothetical protein